MSSTLIIAQAILEKLQEDGFNASLMIDNNDGKTSYTIKFTEKHKTVTNVPSVPTSSETKPRSDSGKLPKTVVEILKTPEDKARYQNLCNWRRLIAHERNASCFIIAHNQLLANIAVRNPQTIEELAKVKGMGQHKLADLGSHIMAVLNGTKPTELVPPSKPSETITNNKNDNWKPSIQLLRYYATIDEISPNSKLFKWCKKKGYNPRDVISGKIPVE